MLPLNATAPPQKTQEEDEQGALFTLNLFQ